MGQNDEKQGIKATKAALSKYLAEVKAEADKRRLRLDTQHSADLTYGRNFENYARNFENYARNFENYARNFENYARNFENASISNVPVSRKNTLPNGADVPSSADEILKQGKTSVENKSR